jgi:hypothetical protein
VLDGPQEAGAEQGVEEGALACLRLADDRDAKLVAGEATLDARERRADGVADPRAEVLAVGEHGREGRDRRPHLFEQRIALGPVRRDGSSVVRRGERARPARHDPCHSRLFHARAALSYRSVAARGCAGRELAFAWESFCFSGGPRKSEKGTDVNESRGLSAVNRRRIYAMLAP